MFEVGEVPKGGGRVVCRDRFCGEQFIWASVCTVDRIVMRKKSIYMRVGYIDACLGSSWSSDALRL